jgi:hypothetical protein
MSKQPLAAGASPSAPKIALMGYYQNKPSQTGAYHIPYDLAEWPSVRHLAFHKCVFEYSSHPTTTPQEQKKDIAYKGPLIFDIDFHEEEGGLYSAINSAQSLTEYLKKLMNEEQFHIYCSGSKGFHVVIPFEVFYGSKGFMHELPSIYKVVAEHIEEKSGAKGIDKNMFRPMQSCRMPNMVRPDGNYKVPITYQELVEITPKKYLEYVKAPRLHITYPTAIENTKVNKLARDALKKIAKETKQLKEQEKKEEAYSEWLNNFKDENPECIKKLVSGSGLDQEVISHRRELELARYINARAETLPDISVDELIESYIVHNQSSRSDRERRDKIKNTILGTKKGYFSCFTMKALFTETKVMCTGCAVQHCIDKKNSANNPIEERDGRTFIRHGRREKMLFDAIITVDELVANTDDDEGSENDQLESMRLTFSTKTQAGSYERATAVKVMLTDFVSLTEFKKRVSRFRGVNPSLSAQDLEPLKAYLVSKVAGSPGMIGSKKIGINRIAAKKEQKFWLEPGACLSQEGKLEKRMFYTGDKVEAVTSLAEARFPGQEDWDVLRRVMKLNRADIVARILGWTIACHLKEHLTESVKQFPLLSISGATGSGKNVTIAILTALAGTNYLYGGAEPPLASVGMSQAARRDFFTRTTTVPMVIDEMHRHKMKPELWSEWHNLLKSAYNKGEIQVAYRKEDSTATQNNNSTIPVVYMSTVEPDEGEVRNRSVNVILQTKMHGIYISEKEVNELRRSRKVRDSLWNIAKYFMLRALNTTDEEAIEMYGEAESKVPDYLTNRSQSNEAYILLGLKFLVDGVKESAADKQVIQDVIELSEQYQSWLGVNASEIAASTGKGEVDEILARWSDLADVKAKPGYDPIVKGMHYVRDGNSLYIHGRKSYLQYTLMCRTYGRLLEYGNAESFIAALKDYPPFISENCPPGSTKTKGWLQLDLDKIQLRGINTDGFSENT